MQQLSAGAELRGVYNVMNTFYLSRVITDPPLIDGETLFWQQESRKDSATSVPGPSLATGRVPLKTGHENMTPGCRM